MIFPRYYGSGMLYGFIKQLLLTTPLPIYETVNELQFLIKGAKYVYRDNIIECTKSGYINSLNSNRPQAEYTIIDVYDYNEDVVTITHRNFSNEPLYDSLTHRWFGEWLRAYKNRTDINLMPFYNCLEIQPVKSNIPGYTAYLAHIHFNTKYTIGIDTTFPIYIQPGFYINNKFTPIDVEHSFFSSYREPLVVSFDTEDLLQYNKQRDLFLLISVPSGTKSSIAVIEGDWKTTYAVENFINNDGQNDLSIPWLNEVLSMPPALLQINIGDSIPFSAVLIEYLLQNTINSTEEIPENIERIQKALFQKLDPATVEWGIWTKDLTILLAQLKQKYNSYYSTIAIESAFETEVESGNVNYSPGLLFYPGQFDINLVGTTLYIYNMNKTGYMYNVEFMPGPDALSIKNVYHLPYNNEETTYKEEIKRIVMSECEDSVALEFATGATIKQVEVNHKVLVNDVDYVVRDNVIYFNEAAFTNGQWFVEGDVVDITYRTYQGEITRPLDIDITVYR